MATSSDPASIDISKSSGVTIVWKDGHRSQFELQYLRDHCPCATCGKKEARPAPSQAPTPLPMFKPRVRIQDAEQVGRYALRFFWSDGHSTGIYSFDHLRGLCPCAECSAALQGGTRPA